MKKVVRWKILPKEVNCWYRSEISERSEINFFAAVFKLFYQHSSGTFCVTIERFASFVYFLGIFSRSRSSYLQAFCKKDVFKMFSEFKGKHLCQSLLSNKVAGCFKKRLLHRSFSVNFWKFIRTAMFCKTSSYIGWSR